VGGAGADALLAACADMHEASRRVAEGAARAAAGPGPRASFPAFVDALLLARASYAEERRAAGARAALLERALVEVARVRALAEQGEAMEALRADAGAGAAACADAAAGAADAAAAEEEACRAACAARAAELEAGEAAVVRGGEDMEAARRANRAHWKAAGAVLGKVEKTDVSKLRICLAMDEIYEPVLVLCCALTALMDGTFRKVPDFRSPTDTTPDPSPEVRRIVTESIKKDLAALKPAAETTVRGARIFRERFRRLTTAQELGAACPGADKLWLWLEAPPPPTLPPTACPTGA